MLCCVILVNPVLRLYTAVVILGALFFSFVDLVLATASASLVPIGSQWIALRLILTGWAGGGRAPSMKLLLLSVGLGTDWCH